MSTPADEAALVAAELGAGWNALALPHNPGAWGVTPNGANLIGVTTLNDALWPALHALARRARSLAEDLATARAMLAELERLRAATGDGPAVSDDERAGRLR